MAKTSFLLGFYDRGEEVKLALALVTRYWLGSLSFFLRRYLVRRRLPLFVVLSGALLGVSNGGFGAHPVAARVRRRDHGLLLAEGVGHNLVCIDATTAGQDAKGSVLWRYLGLQRSLSTVSITPDGLLFVADFTGFVHCLDALSGRVYWKADLAAHVWGSTPGRRRQGLHRR